MCQQHPPLNVLSGLGNSLAPIFAADFPPEAPKFNQRTFHVRLINLCTSDKKSSRKSGYKEFPRVLHKRNGGLVSARKLGISKAVGDYIAFVDGDDYIARQTYSILYQAALDTNADVVYNQTYFSDHNSNITMVSKLLKTGLYSVEKSNMEYIWQHIWDDYENRIAQSACFSLYKKEAASVAYMPIPDKLILTEDQVYCHFISNRKKYIHYTGTLILLQI